MRRCDDGTWIDCNRNTAPDCRRIAPRRLEGALQGDPDLPIMDVPEDWIVDPDGDGPEIICGACATPDEIRDAMAAAEWAGLTLAWSVATGPCPEPCAIACRPPSTVWTASAPYRATSVLGRAASVPLAALSRVSGRSLEAAGAACPRAAGQRAASTALPGGIRLNLLDAQTVSTGA